MYVQYLRSGDKSKVNKESCRCDKCLLKKTWRQAEQLEDNAAATCQKMKGDN